MKLQIDTDHKTIKVLEDVEFSELIKFLKKLLGDELDKYKLVATDTYIHWEPIQPYIPYVPWQPTYPWIIWQTSDNQWAHITTAGSTQYSDECPQLSAGTGIYNIDIQN